MNEHNNTPDKDATKSYRLSFAKVNYLTEQIIEIVIDEGIEITIEMHEEYEVFLAQHMRSNFAVLINRVNSYQYTFEAKLIVASQSTLCALAIVVYNDNDKKLVDELMEMRAIDELNAKVFSGLDLGWQEGFSWLQNEMKTFAIK
ncbi:hypothetical protein [Colwellia sp. E2M01]|uniref:hypothetical protein n=1 Tax=Colwellia sp. E2M01 TaxID=2841561 RepID=UPI001C089BBC|nr:hypothetical protein [Colwellia sp. E2M01]MBU2870362.1 hypothetical protein [Colwellia sp. E2M01]